MAKDPAVLFYTSDFLSGTFTMTNEEKGMYITLLCLQHQKDYLSESDMISVCKAYVERVFSKFIKTEQGYYNERMKVEKEKRSNFCNSRRESVLKGIANKGNKHKKSVRKAYERRMENENANKDIIIDKDIFRKFAHLKITIDENSKILESGYSQLQINSIYDSVQNYKKNTSYSSLYLTALKWLKKEYPDVKPKAEIVERNYGRD